MDSLRDLLKKKADIFDQDGAHDDLHLIQAELDRHFEGRVRVVKLLPQGDVLVHTKGSSLASEVRLLQEQLKQNLNKMLKNKIKSFRIRIK